MSKLLINERPLQVLPTLAKKIGLNEAIALQQLHYWLETSSHVKDGRKWVYNTATEWQVNFPFWSESTVRRVFSVLRSKNLVDVGNYNRAGFDKTLWYTINYAEVTKLESLCDEIVNACSQVDKMDAFTLTTPIPETTTETTTDRSADAQWTSIIAEKLESVGVGLSPFILDEYMELAKESGIEAVVRGITAAAENNKQHRLPYVRTCIRNIAQGDDRTTQSTEMVKVKVSLNGSRGESYDQVVTMPLKKAQAQGYEILEAVT